MGVAIFFVARAPSNIKRRYDWSFAVCTGKSCHFSEWLGGVLLYGLRIDHELLLYYTLAVGSLFCSKLYLHAVGPQGTSGLRFENL